jgi:hypothetical protein
MDVDAIHRSIGLTQERVIFGPDIIDGAEAMMHRIQDNLKATKSHQESYANKRRRLL